MIHQFANYEELKAAILALGEHEILPAVELTPALASDILNHDPVNRQLRKAKVAMFERSIREGRWDPAKAPAVAFLPSGRMVDGQHRCQAVVAADQSIVVMMRVVPDTLGMDQGTPRTLADQLDIHRGLKDKGERQLAALIIRAICQIPNPQDHDLVDFFDANRAFILECIRKPTEWLAEKEKSVTAVIKLPLLAVTRAKEIVIENEPAQEVDMLLFDIVNAGATAPVGSVRRHYAEQIFEALQRAYLDRAKRGAKTKDLVKWTTTALRYTRANQLRDATRALFRSKSKKRPTAKRASDEAEAA